MYAIIQAHIKEQRKWIVELGDFFSFTKYSIPAIIII